ncbi:MAG TPA: sigma-70 family RNA polymerase sigma factor [Bryobacteraceae bacterium]|nr:sigma-70 family RNA polymerase sigma factor [Bryobacteraceae bacterium]
MKDNDELYREAAEACGAALRRLVKGYEADPERRRDLLQEIHIELWRSLRLFDGRCSLRTWVYRVAHNVAATHIIRMRRASARLIDLDALEQEPGFVDGETRANQQYAVSRMLAQIHRLRPLDRQVILLYLEGEPAAAIAEVTGLSASHVATRIHRIKKLLHRLCGEGAGDVRG